MATGKKIVLTGFGLVAVYEAALTRHDSQQSHEMWGDQDYEHAAEITKLLVAHPGRKQAKAQIIAYTKSLKETETLDPTGEEAIGIICEIDSGDHALTIGDPQLLAWVLARVSKQQHMPQWASARVRLMKALRNPVDVELKEV